MQDSSDELSPMPYSSSFSVIDNDSTANLGGSDFFYPILMYNPYNYTYLFSTLDIPK